LFEGYLYVGRDIKAARIDFMTKHRSALEYYLVVHSFGLKAFLSNQNTFKDIFSQVPHLRHVVAG
jgi:hypothetical protein